MNGIHAPQRLWRFYGDRALMIVILLMSAAMRTNLTYRSAFVDEAITLFTGWNLLRGEQTMALNTRMGWPPISCIPLGLADQVGGLAAARGVNAACGVLTVALVMLMARRLYGRAAGYVAGGIWAVSGIAIFVSTFAHSDSLSLLFFSGGLYAWVVASGRHSRWLYPTGSLLLTLSVLTKYPAVVPVLMAFFCGAVWIAREMIHVTASDTDGWTVHMSRPRLVDVSLGLTPFLLLPIYVFLVRDALLSAWNTQVLTKSAAQPGIWWNILSEFLAYAWLPLALSLPALLVREKRAQNLGMLLIGVSLLSYHLLNRDLSTVFKFTTYGLVTLAPLAAAGLTTLVRCGLRREREVLQQSILAGLAVAVVAYLGFVGQQSLPGLRSYWSDTSEAIRFLRQEIQEGERVLMEGGQVGRYYLITKGEPGHIPAQVVDTWWYQDDEGSGLEAYQRGIAEQRFAWIILDYAFTPELNKALLETMEGRYHLETSFPARRFGHEGQIDLFAPIP